MLAKWYLPYTQAATAKVVKTANEQPVFSQISRISHSHQPLIEKTIENGDLNERTAIIEHEAGLPKDWAEAFARVCLMTKPKVLTMDTWQRVIDNTGRLLDGHVHDLIRHGWEIVDVFGCHPRAPEMRLDSKGLLLALRESEAIAVIDARSIALRKPTGNVLYFTKRTNTFETTMIWKLR